jgi:hypothetical protein
MRDDCMQIRKIIFIFALMISALPHRVQGIQLIAEYISTDGVDGVEKIARNVVNFCVPKPEELVPVIPNKTYVEIPTPKIPDVIEKNIGITCQGLVRTSIAILATVYRFNEIRAGKVKGSRKQISTQGAVIQVAKEWAYEIVKDQIIDKTRALLDHYKCIPAFLQDTPENRAKSLLVKIPRYLINKGIDTGLDVAVDCGYQLIVKAVTGK